MSQPVDLRELEATLIGFSWFAGLGLGAEDEQEIVFVFTSKKRIPKKEKVLIPEMFGSLPVRTKYIGKILNEQ